MNYDWMKIIWILVPLAAIIGGITYQIIRLRYGAKKESTNGSVELLLRETLETQRSVMEHLSIIDNRLAKIEKTLTEVPS